jgi:hypothetical protein
MKIEELFSDMDCSDLSCFPVFASVVVFCFDESEELKLFEEEADSPVASGFYA